MHHDGGCSPCHHALGDKLCAGLVRDLGTITASSFLPWGRWLGTVQGQTSEGIRFVMCFWGQHLPSLRVLDWRFSSCGALGDHSSDTFFGKPQHGWVKEFIAYITVFHSKWSEPSGGNFDARR